MLDILLRIIAHHFPFVEFNFKTNKIDATIFNYDRELKELVIWA